MSCFPCFRSRSKKSKSDDEAAADDAAEANSSPTEAKNTETNSSSNANLEHSESKNINAQTFTFRELASATKNFKQETLLGEGGFGRVYKGTLAATGQVVAVKQLDRNGLQGNKEFLVEVLMLSQLHHDNLVKLVGYCADGDQRLLVYEFMSGGSVEDHLLDLKEGAQPLDWKTRMKIAFGAAQGLEYLHDSSNPPIIYRDLKSSNILLSDDFHPKLSDFGLAKLGPSGDNSKMQMQSRVMGTYGYCAPEYSRNGNLTVKSDVYSFGVVLLELITGRRAVDTTKPVNEQNLVSWAQPIFRDPKRFPDMADPLLQGNFAETGLNQAVAIAAMCLQEEPGARPLMSDVMTALSFLATVPDNIPPPGPVPAAAPSEKPKDDDKGSKSSHEESGSSSDEDGSDYSGSASHSDAENSECSEGSEESENTTGEEKKKHIKKNSTSSRKSSRKSRSSSNASPNSLGRNSSRSSKGEGSSKTKKSHRKSLSTKSHRKTKKPKDVNATLSLKKE